MVVAGMPKWNVGMAYHIRHTEGVCKPAKAAVFKRHGAERLGKRCAEDPMLTRDVSRREIEQTVLFPSCFISILFYFHPVLFPSCFISILYERW
jgi:hypothetical protein